MDWPALWLSLQLGGFTVLLLLPVALFVGRLLAYLWRSNAKIGASIFRPLRPLQPA